MKLGKNYFPVPFDGYSARDVRILKRLQGGVVAYGRWITLLGMMYQAGGIIELNDLETADLMSELELDADGLMAFLTDCAKVGMLSGEHLHRGMVACQGVCDRLAYIEQQREHGRKRKA